LLVLNYRPSYRCPWVQAPHFRQLELGELPAADMDALVAELAAPLDALPDICHLISRRAGGNPFFAEELVRTLAESKLLRPGAGLPSGGLAAVEQALPATVQAVVGARLDRLGEPEKTLLQMCAIIGKDIPMAVLEHVASPLARQIEKGLAGLCEAGLVLPAVGGRSFAFRHPLIQEVAYNTQLKVRRSQVHSSVALAMEAYYCDQLDEYAGLIAYHYEAAGRPLDAALHASRAAKWVGSTNPAQAIRHWHKTRALLKGHQRSAEVDRLRALAGGRIVYLGWREGLSLEEVNELIAEAQDLASEADERLPQLLLFAQGRMLQASGPAGAYVDSLEKHWPCRCRKTRRQARHLHMR
jgi:adenylate cyclase